jgi:hypothetical protein
VDTPPEQSTPAKPVPSISVKENSAPVLPATIIPEPLVQKQIAPTDGSTPEALPSPAAVTIPVPTLPPQAQSEPTPALPSPAPLEAPAKSIPAVAPAMNSADTNAKVDSPADTDAANNENGDLPAWLQPQKVAAPPSAPPPAPAPVVAEKNTAIPTQEAPVPQPATMQPEKPAPSTQTQVSEKERERRRLKRQRYRANLRRREEEKSAPISAPQAPADPALNNDPPIAIVRAESITQKESTSPPAPASGTLPSKGMNA